ncbi:uncharacterized protein EDB91DRAFT_244736 [Suillus paluster]|uniref:uncharacterized protein n=1 Tax=Suillus paluster TaxID=48578 RepID=UPI001B8753F1|nr:uncharacterized protein EDB91DRAFT_244736 [Suillus paluster]KAG1721695.1 hypothetical protein EDB91DRAFT_244736 [Suillus paluster]
MMSELTVLSRILPTNFMSTMAGIGDQSGSFRIYFQNEDYKICEIVTSTLGYPMQPIGNGAPVARVGTPIAALMWDNFREIRVYYITTANNVQELVYSDRGSPTTWQKGAVVGTAVKDSACLYAQIQPGSLRIGFQASSDPQTITEAYTTEAGWTTRVL